MYVYFLTGEIITYIFYGENRFIILLHVISFQNCNNSLLLHPIPQINHPISHFKIPTIPIHIIIPGPFIDTPKLTPSQRIGISFTHASIRTYRRGSFTESRTSLLISSSGLKAFVAVSMTFS